MRTAIYIGKDGLEKDARLLALLDSLDRGGCEVYRVYGDGDIREGTDMLLSVGGDGTFLSSAVLAAERGLPVVGVNLGRLGFLSENRPEDVAHALLAGDYTIENRTMLKACVKTGDEQIDSWPYALNEISVRRKGAAMLCVDVVIDGIHLPTYWADGIILSTSAGSTAYSLSVGGPIVFPGAKALIITPIASHNLNIRPLIVPDTSVVSFRVRARDGKAIFTADNRSVEIPDGTSVTMTVAQFSLKRVRLNSSNFINALTEKLFWGEDIRNNR